MGADADEQHWKRFGSWLKAQRVHAGLGRRLVAQAAGVSPSLIKHYEDGMRIDRGRRILPNPRETTLHRIAEALGLPKDVVCTHAGIDCTVPQAQPSFPPAPTPDPDTAAEFLERNYKRHEGGARGLNAADDLAERIRELDQQALAHLIAEMRSIREELERQNGLWAAQSVVVADILEAVRGGK